MGNRAEPRHVFMIFGVCLLVFSPLLVFFMPMFIGETVYYDRYNWIIYLPKINFIVFGLSLVLLILACFTLWLMEIRKRSIFIAVICSVGFVGLAYGSSLSFVTLSDDSITYGEIFSHDKKEELWGTIKQIEYYDDLENEDKMPFYLFHFEDGKELKVVQNGLVTEEIRMKIDQKVRELTIPFTRIHEW